MYVSQTLLANYLENHSANDYITCLVMSLSILKRQHFLFLISVGPVDINEGLTEGHEVITVSTTDLDTLDANTETRYSIVAGNHDVS